MLRNNFGQIIGQVSIIPGVVMGTRSNVKPPPGLWGHPGIGGGLGHEIDRCINGQALTQSIIMTELGIKYSIFAGILGNDLPCFALLF